MYMNRGSGLYPLIIYFLLYVGYEGELSAIQSDMSAEERVISERAIGIFTALLVKPERNNQSIMLGTLSLVLVAVQYTRQKRYSRYRDSLLRLSSPKI